MGEMYLMKIFNNEKEITIDVSTLSEGVYFLKSESNSATFIKE